MERPFRFGVQCAMARTRGEWQDRARRVEQVGYQVLLVPDHLGPQLATFPALLSAADATRELRVGTLVIDNDFRHPALLAKEAASIDVLCDGRLELGIGAGWMRSEYEQAGMAFDPAPVRVARMEEAVAVLKAVWAGGPARFQGSHYVLRDLESAPAPVQTGGPPLLIGGGGPRILRFASRVADIVGLVPRSLPEGGLDLTDISMEAFERKLDVVREAAGARFADLELNSLAQAVAVTDARDRAAQALAGAFGVPADAVLESPLTLIGTDKQIEETLLERRERLALSYWVVFERDMEAFAPIAARLAGR